VLQNCDTPYEKRRPTTAACGFYEIRPSGSPDVTDSCALCVESVRTGVQLLIFPDPGTQQALSTSAQDPVMSGKPEGEFHKTHTLRTHRPLCYNIENPRLFISMTPPCSPGITDSCALCVESVRTGIQLLIFPDPGTQQALSAFAQDPVMSGKHSTVPLSSC